MFENLQTDETITDETDRLGGGMPESGAYETVVEWAYVEKSQGGSLGLHLSLQGASGINIRNSIYMTGGTAKGGKNFYIDRQGNKQYLPGFITANALAQLAAGAEISTLKSEPKTLMLYDFDLQKETPQEKEVLTELSGKKISVGLIKQTVNKNVKNADGVYVPTAETRDELVIDKFFEAGTGCTTVEKKAGLPKGEFIEKWAAKNSGITRDKTVQVAAAPGQQQAAQAGQQTASLFS